MLKYLIPVTISLYSGNTFANDSNVTEKLEPTSSTLEKAVIEKTDMNDWIGQYEKDNYCIDVKRNGAWNGENVESCIVVYRWYLPILPAEKEPLLR